MALLVVYAHPQYFADTKIMHTDVRLMYFFGIMIIFPVFSLFLMKKLEIIGDLNSEDGKERFIPMIAIGTFWLWAYVMFKEGALYATASYYPLGLSILGSIISLFILFPFNFTSRIAWHVVGMGSFLSLLFNIFSTSYYNLVFVLVLAVVAVGWVVSAQITLHQYSRNSLLFSFLIGFFGQFIAFKIWFPFFG